MGKLASGGSDRYYPVSPLRTSLIRIHDARTTLGDSGILGLNRYSDRALLLPGSCVVEAGVDKNIIDYLASIGLGAPASGEVIVTPHGVNLFDALTDTQFEKIKGHINSGDMIECFQAADPETKFAQRLGHPLEACFNNASQDQAAQVNSKIWLREYAQQNQVKVKFPPFALARVQEGDIFDAVEKLLRGTESGVWVKAASLSAGRWPSRP